MPDLSPRPSSRQKGDRGEELASRYLAEKEYEALACNCRTRHGEFDLIVCNEHALIVV